MVNTKLREWLLNNDPSKEMLWCDNYWRTYRFIDEDILPFFFMNKDHDWDAYCVEANNQHDVIGEHYSKSIKNPAIIITYKGVEIVFRNNFYDWEVFVNSPFEVYIYNDRLFMSKDTNFFYQGIPTNYRFYDNYEVNKKQFKVSLDNPTYLFFTFIYLLKTEIDKNSR